jgi:ubiquinone/menaquinone biosynthesis C-methylase UbiE|tara:strand:+ start:3701 stop:4288 length:588 start_codon:yes stop_codon:yes gene_type:complete
MSTLKKMRCFGVNYDTEFWKNYALENESRINEEFTKFITDLAMSLRCTSVLEIGCGTGIDLQKFQESFEVYGLDLNDYALDIARKNLPNVNFKNGDITKIPYEDSSIDFIFTHKLLNYLDDETLDAGVAEMFRVSRKYIVNCELFRESEEQIDENMKYRNMLKRWMNYNVKVISNVDMHEDIDSEKVRFTLLRKL